LRENAANQCRRLPPVVIAKAVHDEHADFTVAHSREQDIAGEEDGQAAKPNATVHNRMLEERYLRVKQISA